MSSTRAQVLTDIIAEDNPKNKTSNLFNLSFDKDKRIWFIVLGIDPDMLNSISSLVPVAMVKSFYDKLKKNDKKGALSYIQDEDKGYIEEIFNPSNKQDQGLRPRLRPMQPALQQTTVIDELKKNEISIKDTKTIKNVVIVKLSFNDKDYEEYLKEINGRWFLLPKKSELITYLKIREGNTQVPNEQDTDLEKKQ